MERYEFNRQLAQAVRAMAEESSTGDTLERAVKMATDMMPACDVAGVSVAYADRIETPAASDEALRLIDEHQFRLKEGPCFDALRQDDVVICADLSIDPRWPRWGPLIAEETGVRASMSFRLFTDGKNLGALNLYSKQPDAFEHDDMLDGLALAAHAAVALTATLEVDHLHHAVRTRQTIGEAIGILRERFDLTSAQSFSVLVRLSSYHNVKLFHVAQHLVDTGELLEPPGESRTTAQQTM